MAPPQPLTRLLQQGVQTGVFPGAVLFIRHRGRVQFLEAVGHLSTLPQSPSVQPSTVYDLASLTKPLATSSAILLLVQDGVLNLDSSLHSILEETRNASLGTATIKELLCHQSGLPDWRPLYQGFPPVPPADLRSSRQRKAVILEKILDEPRDESPFKRSVYSDLGYIVLGFVVERLTEQPLAGFCRTRIFEPLETKTLGYRPWHAASEENAKGGIAPTEHDPWRGWLLQGEVHDNNAHVLGGVAGHAGLFGSAEDVGKVTGAWLDGYHGQTSLFHPELVRQFVRSQPGTSWGLGWDTPSQPSSSGQWFSPESFGHLGFTGTSIWIDPLRELEVIFLSNRVHPTRDNQAIKTFRPKLHDCIVQNL